MEETVQFQACKKDVCVSVKLTGEDIAKITLVIMAGFALGFVLHKIA